MNRFTIACRAFAEGLATTPSVADTRAAKIAETKRRIKYAEGRVRRAQQELLDAKNELFRAEARLGQLEQLPDEAFEVLVS